MSEKPKPCVKCKCNLIALGRDKLGRVYRICVNCDAKGPICDTVREASEAWNKRDE